MSVRRKKRAEGHVNHERWLVSYADFITLLFAFFVVLFASSQADKKKQAQVAEAVKAAFTEMGVFDPASKTLSIAHEGGAASNAANTPQLCLSPAMFRRDGVPSSAVELPSIRCRIPRCRRRLKTPPPC